MSELEEIVIDGIPRKMGRIEPSEDALKMRAGMMGLAEYLDIKGVRMLTRDQWPKRLGRYRDTMGTRFINDQGQFGACFPTGTLVRMADGSQKPINEVRLLDKVITAEGNEGEVTCLSVRTESEQLIQLHLWGHRHLKATAEHPILTKRGYVKIGKLKVGDEVAIPKVHVNTTSFIQTANHVMKRWWAKGLAKSQKFYNRNHADPIVVTKTDLPDVIRLTPQFGRIIGLFLAEGFTSAGRAAWVFSTEKESNTLVPELIGLLKDCLGIEAHTQVRPNNSTIVVAYGVRWADLFKSLCSDGSKNKKLHPDLTSGPRDFLDAVLKGWISGDGYGRRKVIQGVTISRVLAMQMFDIANSLGKMPTIRRMEQKPDHIVKSRQPRWDIEFVTSKPRGDRDWRREQDAEYVWRKVAGIVAEEFSGPVYNMTVEGDNSYIAEGIGVHNCVGYSAAQSEMRERELRGQKFVVLSGSYIYDQINGGRDNGACITDSMTELISDGVPPADDYPSTPQFNRRTQPASRLRFKLGKGIVLTTFDEMVNAILLLNAIPQYPYQVGPSYNPGPSGKCGVSNGPGNHSVHGDDVAWIDNEWCIDHAGSWGTRWGNQGRAYHTERGIMSCAMQNDAYCKIWVIQDPTDPLPGV